MALQVLPRQRHVVGPLGPLFRNANLSHQMLLALARVVTTLQGVAACLRGRADRAGVVPQSVANTLETSLEAREDSRGL